jgi:hypothetical protein
MYFVAQPFRVAKSKAEALRYISNYFMRLHFARALALK